jgi:hypothetical protein
MLLSKNIRIRLGSIIKTIKTFERVNNYLSIPSIVNILIQTINESIIFQRSIPVIHTEVEFLGLPIHLFIYSPIHWRGRQWHTVISFILHTLLSVPERPGVQLWSWWNRGVFLGMSL